MTNTESTNDQRIIAYVSAVSVRLAGIPEEERAEILEDLRDHLREVSKENPDQSLDEIVGSPSAYAEELLASSGVTVDPGVRTKAPRTERIAERAEKFFNSLPFADYLRDLLPVLQPSWWVLRAYLFAAVALSVFSVVFGLFDDLMPFPRSFAALIVVLALTAMLIPTSVALGRRTLAGRARPGMWVLNGILVFIFLVAANSERYDGYSGAQSYYSSEPTAVTSPGGGSCLVDSANMPITNLFAYDANGTLIPQVLLFDQSGKALNNLCPDNNSNGEPLRNEYAKDANGAAIYNAFPRKQWVTPYDNNSGIPQTEKAVLPPAIVTPKVAETTTTTAAPAETTTTIVAS